MVIIHASLVPDSSDFSVGSPSERVAAVRERIAVAAARSGRSAQAVRLLAVVKFQPVDAVRAVRADLIAITGDLVDLSADES
ncbi:MAG: hypothetical protein ACOVT5_07340, partial [Armatimonadaceae bacterium]